MIEQELATKNLKDMSPKNMGRKLTLLGGAGTLAYLCWLGSYGWAHKVLSLPPAELGSFLGGAVGPLAFVWLVLGFFQQGIELRHSARALWLQSEELRNSVEQQKALVDVSREQLEHEKSERIRLEEEAERFAAPSIGVQSNGSLHSDGRRQYTFMMVNVGAAVTSVRLMEGEKSHGEAATWGPSQGLSVIFLFEADEPTVSRELTISFIDARGKPATKTMIFPAVGQGEQATLVTPSTG